MSGVLDQFERWGPVAATVVCLGLGAALWIAPAPPPPPATAPQTSLDTALRSELAALEQSAQDLAQRPVFHMTRRPVVQAEPVAADVAPLSLTLTGIINSDDIQIALLRLSDDPRLIRRQVGERAGPWLVTEITPTAVTVLGDDGQETVIFLSQARP